MVVSKPDIICFFIISSIPGTLGIPAGTSVASICRVSLVLLPSASKRYVLVTSEAGGAAKVFTPNFLFGSNATTSFVVVFLCPMEVVSILYFVPNLTGPSTSTPVM